MMTAPAINFMFTAIPVRPFNKNTLFLMWTMWINFTELSERYDLRLCVQQRKLNTQNPALQIFFNDCTHTDHIYLHIDKRMGTQLNVCNSL